MAEARRVLVAVAVFLSLGAWTFLLSPRFALADEAPAPEEVQEGNQGPLLCPPMAGGGPGTCVAYGPSAVLQDWYRQEWQPDVDLFPGVRLTDAWFQLPKRLYYAWVKAEKAVLFRNPADPDSSPRRTIPHGFLYVSYEYSRRFGSKNWLYVSDGFWIQESDVMRVRPSTFRGFLFIEPPERPFGWIRYTTVMPRTGPGWQYPRAGTVLKRYQKVEVWDKAKGGRWMWYKVGPDQWIPEYTVALVFPRTSPPPGVPSHRWIEVNVYEQTLAVYENNRLRYATMIATGTGNFYTRVGVFQIYEKLPLETMQGSFLADRSDFYYLQDVPWTMYYDGARALHGTYWHDNFGFPQSRGCVNLSIVDAYWVFQWAKEGDWVYVWDPSGRTPSQ